MTQAVDAEFDEVIDRRVLVAVSANFFYEVGVDARTGAVLENGKEGQHAD